jgi:Bacteriocin-protection, YdeI or OmpD-Associated/Domain of unknown function (DUF1905)
MVTNAKPKRFLATVYKIWMMRHVDVPEEVSAALIKQLTKSGQVNGSSKRVRHEPHSGKPQRRASNGTGQRDALKPKYVPVIAIVNGRSARVTLVPAGGGRFRMQINTVLRKAARVDVGDVVGVELRLDLESRELPVPRDLRDGLKAVPKARKAFESLTPAHRRHFVQWFDSAKSAEARQRRLERAIDVLLERALLKPRRKPVRLF